MEHERCRDQRQWNRDQRDQGRSPGEAEGDEGQEHQEAADQCGQPEIVERFADVVRRPEHRRIAGDAGQTGAERLQGILDPFGDLSSADSGELLDDQEQAGSTRDDGVTDQRLVIDLDVGDVAQLQSAAGTLDRNAGQLARIGDLLEQMTHLQPLLRGFDETAGTGG